MIALIDADSLIYIIAWNHKEHTDPVLVKESCDSFLRDIVTITQSTGYIGVFSDKTCFRHRIYKFAEYKGNRKEKQEWTTRWETVIKDHFIQKHGFIVADDLEADDVVAAIGWDPSEHIICSPDKDLKQIAGLHYDYRASQGQKVDFDNNETVINRPYEISPHEAAKYLAIQVLMGDMGDNVYGVVNMGEVKAKKLLADCLDPMIWPSAIQAAYVKQYGPYYGPIIYRETLDTIMMLGPEHRLWDDHRLQIQDIYNTSIRTLDTAKGIFDV